MNLFLKEAFAMKDNIIENRRYIHENAELGFDLPKTRAFVIKQLTSLGYAPILLGEGITCTIGSGQPVILLRADMDALPQTETSGLDFASDRRLSLLRTRCAYRYAPCCCGLAA